MRLLRLRLEHWRGIEDCDIAFDRGVTLIEGANEAGKSTLVEALRTLIDEPDSSAKQRIRSIQPVGTDVGSRVEAELECGELRLVYGKTYNRGRRTELRIEGPRPEQLTGREAHDRAREILEQEVDLGLWRALLLEQGGANDAVDLAESASLARALDAAAGGDSGRQDGALYRAAQAEYERYFTPAAGREKFGGLVERCERAEREAQALREILDATEADSEARQRCLEQVRRGREALPDLQRQLEQCETEAARVGALQQEVRVREAELDALTQRLESARAERDQRRELRGELARQREGLAQREATLAPRADEQRGLERAEQAARAALVARREARERARAELERARRGLRRRQAEQALSDLRRRLSRLAQCDSEMAAARAGLASIAIDGQGLEQLRDAEHALQLALGRSEDAGAALQVIAEAPLRLSIDGESAELAAGDRLERRSARQQELILPGLARITVAPPPGAQELEQEAAHCRRQLDDLRRRFAVDDLAQAVAEAARRAELESDLRSAAARRAELLGESDEQVLQRQREALEQELRGTREEDPSGPSAAAIAEGEHAVQSAEQALRQAEQDALDAEATLEQAAGALRDFTAGLHLEQQQLAGERRHLQQSEQRLAERCTDETDEVLEARLAQLEAQRRGLLDALDAARAALRQADPESASLRLENARATCRRAAAELAARERELAVLEDRLEQARASGSYEQLERADAEVELLREELLATRRRAAAAERLWEVLNRHRDATRRNYVKPLREGIERLGRLVFGSDFGVELDPQWRIVSCHREGRSIPFEDLSVGTREQLGILTRLAAARIVSARGGVPLIIDDALGFSDPQRLRSMGTAIAAAGNDAQVILLSCSPGRYTHVGNAKLVEL